MSAFLIVVIVVAAIAILLLGTRFFRTRPVIDKLGDSPAGFAHPEDKPVSEQPSEDTHDEPLPHRPLRGRD
jgi:hypothetical protein